ncbi:MAG TPA: nicotinate-nucleotide adenylyltransferase [Thermoleophilaceae bacterium]|nr:nicotinate-nucleotide adenylyltransferase [Thermoleophilaceae bacterium]
MRVGIYGGVFNPPHHGHLVAAQEAHWQLGLDVVVWIPVADAPHRVVEDDPGAEARFEMVEMAIAGDERFRVSRIEIERGGPSYTVDTLRQLREREPEAELFLILGGDQALALPSWHEPEQVLELATLAVFERGSSNRNAIAIKVARLRGAERVRFLDMPRIDISSTAVRRRAATGKPIRYLVPDKVAHFIGARSLYGASEPASTNA